MSIQAKTMFEYLLPEKGSGRFYVYILFRPNGQPFYVGKGCGDRIARHEYEARRGHKCHKCNVIRKIWSEGGEVERQIVFTTDSELVAFQFEAQLIQRFRHQLANVADYDARIWQLTNQPQPRKSKKEQQQERLVTASLAISALERKLRRAVLVRDYGAQDRIEEEIDAYRVVLLPPKQLQLENFGEE